MSGARLILASASPRRARLLTEAGIAFVAKSPDVDERLPPGAQAEDAAESLALLKARAIDAPGAWVLAADTLGALDTRILGKPRDPADAFAMLRALSGRAHRVVTGVAVRAPGGGVHHGHEVTRVHFRALSDEEIEAYIATGEPMDKAGAYGIQSGGATFVTGIEGPMDNVVGLPLGLTRRLLVAAGFPLGLPDA